MPGHWSVMSRRKVNQIYSANAEKPQLHWNHSSLNRLVIAGTDRQMRLTKQLVKRNASHLACTVQQMNGFCWGVSPGLVDRGLKSELSSLSNRGDKDRPVYFTHSFFSRGLFTTNPLGLRGAAGPVSNAAPPLWRPESLAALWRQIKELDSALCVSEVTLVDPILIPDSGLLQSNLAGHYLSLTTRYASVQPVVIIVWPGWMLRPHLQIDIRCTSLVRPVTLFLPFFPPLLDTLNHSAHFFNSVHCLRIKSTLNMSHSTRYLSLWGQDFLTELKPYFSLNKRTPLLFKLSIQTLATSPNRYVTGIPSSTANSNYLVKGIRALVR